MTIGFVIYKCENHAPPSKRPLPDQLLHVTKCSQLGEVSAVVELDPADDVIYYVVPSTYDQGETGSYTLEVFSECACVLMPVSMPENPPAPLETQEVVVRGNPPQEHAISSLGLLYRRIIAPHPWFRSEEAAASNARRLGREGRHEDPEFQANGTSLYHDTRQPPAGCIKPSLVKWKRPYDINPNSFLFANNSPIIQGVQVRNGWFLDAAAMIAMSDAPSHHRGQSLAHVAGERCLKGLLMTNVLLRHELHSAPMFFGGAI